MMPVKKGKRLLAIRGVAGAVEIEHDDVRVLGKRGDVVGLELSLQTNHGARRRRVFQARERGLRREPTRVIGEPVTGRAPERVVPKRVGVVLILVPEGDLEQALAYLFDAGVDNALGGALIGQQRRDAAREAEPFVELPEQEQPAVVRGPRGIVRQLERAVGVEVEAGVRYTGCRRHGGSSSVVSQPHEPPR